MSSRDKELSAIAANTSDDQYGILFPSLERIPLENDGVAGGHVDLRVDNEGHPLPAEGETILSRWFPVAALAMDLDGTVGRDDLSSASYVVYKGGLRLAITDRRVIGAFNSALTEKWGLVSTTQGEQGTGEPAVLGLSWPHEEITSVLVNWKKKIFGKPEFTACQIRGARPVSAMPFDFATAANEQWHGPKKGAATPNGLREMAYSIAQAAAAYRIDHGPGYTPELEAIRQGQFEVIGEGSAIASLEKPDSQ